MKKLCILAIATLSLLVACHQEENPGEKTVITVSAQQTKTALGAISGSKRPVYWADGDCLAMNGVASQPLSGVPAQATTAQFVFTGAISGSAPYDILYPASLYKDATTVTLPATQAWAANDVVSIPLAAQVDALTGETADLAHLGAILHLRLKKDTAVEDANLISATFKGNAGEQVCGDFTIDYASATLIPAGEGAEVSLSLNQALSATEDLNLYLTIPAQTYSHGFTVVFEDASHRTMTCATADASMAIDKGQLLRSAVTYFQPSALAGSLELDGVGTESLGLNYNVTGRVVDTAGNALSGVVVSDGLQCVRTLSDGRFYMTSNIAKTKFVWVSTPSGYLPPVSGGIPQFYKTKASISPSAGIYDFGNYVLTPVANPNRFTLLISADPQPRKYENWNNDRIAFRSLDACEDLYAELKAVADGISDRQVYGICLGDIVHEDMSLMDNYAAGLATLGYPTYNAIGNHDHDPEAADDAAGAIPFENHFGPANYSFNIGGIHFVVVDNMIMAHNGAKLDIDPNHDRGGLTDDIWTWLQSDLAFIPTSTKLMVCSHAPMFKAYTGGDRTGGTHPVQYGPEYGDLINNYTEVHAWAGHTHSTFNYIYPTDHRNKRVQVHTLARSTGELWTNEYLSSGTPRGFTVVEVDNGTITWKFHPNPRQTGSFMGITSGVCSAGAPAYNWRDWNYSGGTAVMKSGGALTDNYQMHVYPRGAYGDNYVYVNVFLWDDKWSTPTWTPTGGTPVEMTRLIEFEPENYDTDEKLHAYDLGTAEFKTHYKDNVGFFTNDDGYPAKEMGKTVTLFRAPADATPAGGTVSVQDRFGNVYTSSVSW